MSCVDIILFSFPGYSYCESGRTRGIRTKMMIMGRGRGGAAAEEYMMI